MPPKVKAKTDAAEESESSVVDETGEEDAPITPGGAEGGDAEGAASAGAEGAEGTDGADDEPLDELRERLPAHLRSRRRPLFRQMVSESSSNVPR